MSHQTSEAVGPCYRLSCIDVFICHLAGGPPWTNKSKEQRERRLRQASSGASKPLPSVSKPKRLRLLAVLGAHPASECVRGRWGDWGTERTACRAWHGDASAEERPDILGGELVRDLDGVLGQDIELLGEAALVAPRACGHTAALLRDTALALPDGACWFATLTARGELVTRSTRELISPAYVVLVWVRGCFRSEKRTRLKAGSIRSLRYNNLRCATAPTP
eukprot:112327-Prorocentrum_minimum.AAC.3